MNSRKLRIFILGFAMMLVGNVAFAQFSGVRQMVESRIPQGFQNLIISDESEAANEKVRDFTNGNFSDEIIVVSNFLESEQPITANQLRFANRDLEIDIEIAMAIQRATDIDYFEILYHVDLNDEERTEIFEVITPKSKWTIEDPYSFTEIALTGAEQIAVMLSYYDAEGAAKIISYAASMAEAVIKSRRNELEVTFTAVYPDGRELHGWIGFASVLRPDINSIISEQTSVSELIQAGIAVYLVNEMLTLESLRRFFDSMRVETNAYSGMSAVRY